MARSSRTSRTCISSSASPSCTAAASGTEGALPLTLSPCGRRDATETAMEKRISLEIENGVAEVRLARGDKMNALDTPMFSALIETGERLKREAGVRVVVISGEGRAFCAGLDMGSFGKMAEGGSHRAERPVKDFLQRTMGPANWPQSAVWVWREVPVPV